MKGLPELGMTARVRWSDEVGEAAWIAAGLDDFLASRVTSVVPHGFAAYARVLHAPAVGPGSGHAGRWGELAARNGVALEPGTPFHRVLVAAPTPRSPTAQQGRPYDGSLGGEDAHALVDVLAGHTAPGARCWFAIWEGWGSLRGAVLVLGTDPEAVAARQAAAQVDLVPPEVDAGPRVEPNPYRRHLLYTGELPDALAFVRDGPVVPGHQTPALWWPQDRSWCVGTEIDDEVTYVGGCAELIAALHADPRLETQPAAAGEPKETPTPPDWLVESLDPAAEALLRHGETAVRTTVLTLLAVLTGPERHLEVADDRGGSGWRPYGPVGDDDAARGRIVAALQDYLALMTRG